MSEPHTTSQDAINAHAMRMVWNEQPPNAELDVDALMEGMKLTPWERIVANDIAVNYLNSLKHLATSNTLVSTSLPH